MILGVPRESRREEQRVAASPDTVVAFVNRGFSVRVERGAGEASLWGDELYEAAGAQIVDSEAVWAESDVVLKVARPTRKEAALLRAGALLICSLETDENDALVKQLANRGATLLAAEAVPRITRAQKMDLRSSMANLVGYRAVIEAAGQFGRTLGPAVTAAGSVRPASVLVIGAGVAGLAAVAAARSLGAEVAAFDTREAAKDQVKSLGGAFLSVSVQEEGEDAGGYAKAMSQAFVDAEMALFREQAPKTDIVICTALVPGRPAPRLWLADMVESMPDGAVVVDLAARQGGNCECTVAGKVVQVGRVKVVGEVDLTQKMAPLASRLLSANMLALVDELGTPEAWSLDLENEILRAITVVQDGEVRWPAPRPEPKPPPATEVAKPAPTTPPQPPTVPARVWVPATFGAALAVFALGAFAPAEFMQHLTVFVLSCFLGWQVVWSVTPALHTPLMSVTNAISGIIIVGGMFQMVPGTGWAAVLGFAAIFFAAINVVGGFAVTARMLEMFQSRGVR